MGAPYEAPHARRIMEIAVEVSEATNTLTATAVKFYRDQASLDAGHGYDAAFVPGAAGAAHEIELGEVLPAPNVIRLVTTFV